MTNFISFEAGHGLKGFEKRGLRAIANRLKQSKILITLQQPKKFAEDSEGFLLNLIEQLSAREMVNIKLDVEKKSEAKIVALQFAEKTESEIVQVVGHSVLLYKRANPPKEVSELLSKEVISGMVEN